MIKKVKNTIPVYDICSLESNNQSNGRIIAEPFAAYLQVHPNLHLPHRHSFYHIVLFTKGGGFHSIDFENFEVRTGQIYFMAPGQVHSWKFKGEVDGYVVNFSENFFENFLTNNRYLDSFPFFQGIVGESVIELSKELSDEAEKMLRTIVEEVHLGASQMHDMVRSCLIQLFILVKRQIVQSIPIVAKPHNQLLLHNFRKLVETLYTEKRLPKDYATMLYITPNHLNALCKDLIGKSAGEVIRDRILLEAKRLLINAAMGISEIAARLNFTDSSHFTKFFKKHTNKTPEEFRRNSMAHD